MAFRSEKKACAAVVAALWLASALFAQTELRYEARHHHWRKYGTGSLVVSERGVLFQEAGKKQKIKHTLKLGYQDIQELKLSPNKMTIVTYKDRTWRLGMDQQYEFSLPSGQSFNGAYAFLKNRLDQRFVVALADPEFQPLWEMPVKLLGRIQGSEGILQAGSDRIVYKTDRWEQSRTWRYEDIENISTSGPYQLTLTTYERAKMHYGSLKGFNFQLKERLDERRFNLLWQRVNQSKGLRLLTSIEEEARSR